MIFVLKTRCVFFAVETETNKGFKQIFALEFEKIESDITQKYWGS